MVPYLLASSKLLLELHHVVLKLLVYLGSIHLNNAIINPKQKRRMLTEQTKSLRSLLHKCCIAVTAQRTPCLHVRSGVTCCRCFTQALVRLSDKVVACDQTVPCILPLLVRPGSQRQLLPGSWTLRVRVRSRRMSLFGESSPSLLAESRRWPKQQCSARKTSPAGQRMTYTRAK